MRQKCLARARGGQTFYAGCFIFHFPVDSFVDTVRLFLFLIFLEGEEKGARGEKGDQREEKFFNQTGSVGRMHFSTLIERKKLNFSWRTNTWHPDCRVNRFLFSFWKTIFRNNRRLNGVWINSCNVGVCFSFAVSLPEATAQKRCEWTPETAEWWLCCSRTRTTVQAENKAKWRKGRFASFVDTGQNWRKRYHNRERRRNKLPHRQISVLSQEKSIN